MATEPDNKASSDKFQAFLDSLPASGSPAPAAPSEGQTVLMRYQGKTWVAVEWPGLAVPSAPPAPPPAPTPPAPPPAPPAPAPAPAAGTVLAQQGGRFTLEVPTRVRYGADATATAAGGWYACDLAAGSYVASDDPATGGAFPDPAYGLMKSAVSMGPATGAPPATTSVAPPPPAPPAPTPPAPPSPTPPPAPVSGDNIVKNGVVDKAARRALAQAAGTESWVNYVRGPQADAATQAKGFAIPATPITKPWPASSGQRDCMANYGKYNADPGLYSTAQHDVIGVPVGADSPGWVTVQSSGYSNACAELIPQGRWQNGYRLTHDNLTAYRGEGTLPKMGKLYPVFTTTNDDLGEDNGPSRMIGYVTRQVVGGGGNTAMNKCRSALPGNRVPLAGAMTGSGEVLCVPCLNLDTDEVELAIGLCAGRADGTDWKQGRTSEDWWNEWTLTYPGMPNRGNTVFCKFVGFVKLDLALPTSVQCSTGMHPWKLMTNGSKGFMFASTPIVDHLGDLRDGGKFAGGIARGGVAVVGSPSDGKIAVVDLYPLFENIWQTYLGSNPNAATPDKIGMNDDQHPVAFSKSGVSLPVYYLTPGGQVQDIRLTVTSGMMWVATNVGDVGKVSVYDLTTFQPGNVKRGAGNFASVKKVSEIGSLPFVSHLAQTTGYKATWSDVQNRCVHITSRKTRQIGTVGASADFKTLSLVQPLYTPPASHVNDIVAQSDIQNYANASNSQLLLGFEDQKVACYRTDQMDLQPGFPSQPKPNQVSGVRVVFEGAISTPDMKPWDASGANVP